MYTAKLKKYICYDDSYYEVVYMIIDLNSKNGRH